MIKLTENRAETIAKLQNISTARNLSRRLTKVAFLATNACLEPFVK